MQSSVGGKHLEEGLEGECREEKRKRRSEGKNTKREGRRES